MRGSKPERWVRQTQFDNDEAVGYLADRLARLGVEQELAERGALPGASVTIGDYVFDFEPTGGMADEAYQPTRRGADERLDSGQPAERRAAAGRQAGPPATAGRGRARCWSSTPETSPDDDRTGADRRPPGGSW